MSKPPVNARGYDAYDVKATPTRRVLAHLTDLPTLLAGPVLGVFFLGQAPIPDLPTFLTWILWAAIVLVPQRWFYSRTLGERLWGIRHFKDLGCMEKKSWSLFFQLQSLIALIVSLAFSLQMVLKTAGFHPMLRPALQVQIPTFNPAPTDGEWSVLPFYLTIAAFPKLWHAQPVWYQLPYVKGPPERFPARVVARLPGVEGRILLEGPRTPEELRGKRDWVKACLTSPEVRVRMAATCMGLRRGLLLRHSRELKPGGSLPRSWGLYWFEVDNPQLGADSRPMGVYIKAENKTHETHRFILLTSDGQAQAMTLELPRSQAPGGTDATFAPELQMVFQVVGSMSLHPTLAGSRSWADRRLSEIKLEEIARKPELHRLGELAALLIAKTTVSPRQSDAYYHLAGVSLLLLKKSATTPAAELVSAIARPQVAASQRFMMDVAPTDPRNRQLEQMVLEMKQFK